jgi:predicted O-methyltransferase YrrM
MRSRPWIERAAKAATPGMRSGLVTGLAAGLGFAVLGVIGRALGFGSDDEIVLGSIAVFVVTAAVTTIVISRVRAVHRELSAFRAELPAIAGLAPLAQGYPLPFGGSFPMSPDALGELARLAAERKPDLIVELGSGLSSLVLGLTVRRLGTGRVVSFDHSPEWADQTRARLSTLGLTDVVTVVDAPLIDIEVDGTRRRWYDLAGALPDEPIDMLVVDGPPVAGPDDWGARWPALPVLDSRLSARAVVYLDDASRAGEREAVRRWVRDVKGWTARRVPTQRGGAILERISDGRSSRSG